jgi:hypothetical protein
MQPLHLIKIRGICDALVAARFDAHEQAEVLRLPRSATWSILHGNRKKSGLSANLVTRMIKSPRLPQSVRPKIIEYVAVKISDGHGQNKQQQRRFRARLETAV